jgi:hypothetical protein
MGFSVKKAFRKVAGGKVADAVSKVVNTKNLSIVAPYTTALTTKGRAELLKTYKPLVSGAMSLYGGGGAAAAGMAALDSYQATSEDVRPYMGPAPSDAGGWGGGAGSMVTAPVQTGGAERAMPWWRRNLVALIAGGVGLVAVAILLFRKK